MEQIYLETELTRGPQHKWVMYICPFHCPFVHLFVHGNEHKQALGQDHKQVLNYVL